METFHIHIKGRVQGVGFRPFVYRLATALNIKGWVRNSTDGVHIRFNCSSELASEFYNSCLTEKPIQALIKSSELIKVDDELFDDFRITESQNVQLEISITPDFAICKSCISELGQPGNFRYQYPFITCTECGPRYSILNGLPYDRELTSMAPFKMCRTCENEYNDPMDRRYFSQTNSCASCGIQLSLSNADGVINQQFNSSEIITFIANKLRAKHIVAVKGIGGFLLIADANTHEAIAKLRERKNRPSKPFAILYQSIEKVEEHFLIGPHEKRLLTGPVSPIVLLKPKSSIRLASELIAPGLEKIGVMIPYAPILSLITNKFDGPLIATSANVSGSPIVHDHDESGLSTLADFIVSNNRKIHFPQDDSVIQFSPKHQQQIILRKARGLAPLTFTSMSQPGSDTLALGAEMKGSFAISLSANTYVSQYLGNLSNYDNQLQFELVKDRFLKLVQADINQILIDSHPGYYSHQLGKTLAKECKIPHFEIPHHEAHFAAILAERELINQDQVLGVIWDGTGYGADGHTWGGEFFDYTDQQICRIAHIDYFQVLSNDRMAIDNRLCALSLASPEKVSELQGGFQQTEWDFYSKILVKPTQLTSSIGRIFDAVAYLAGISNSNTYEGQSAMLLEQDAKKVLALSGNLEPYSFEVNGSSISVKKLMNEVFHDRKTNPHVISVRFHLTLVEIVRDVAIQHSYRKIAFSGGVFQNGLLVDLLIDYLSKDFELYFHQKLSPNDENIAFGQLAHLQIRQQKNHRNFKTIEQCV
ncbi:MAG: carbamoyltransferase HypF [Bacteroidota bacterium]